MFHGFDRKINVSSWIVIARLPNGFPRQKITSWRLADSLPPGELSDGKYAAQLDVERVISNTHRALVTFTEHKNMYGFIDAFRIGLGHKNF